MGLPSFHYEIKAKTQSENRKQRQTIPKQIKALAMVDVRAAIALAATGEPFTQVQRLFFEYYRTWRQKEQMKAFNRYKVKPPFKRNPSGSEFSSWAIDECIRRDRKKLCRIFIQAVDSHDSKRIIEIAKAVEFFKNFTISGDHFRYHILCLKEIMDKTGNKSTIREVAEFIGWPDKHGQDGFSALRRMCNELDFPLAPSRKIRTK